MSGADLDPATLARSLRCMAGDGSVEWVMEPMQASVLLDIADMLDENAKLRHVARELWTLFLKHAAVSPNELPKVDEVRETLYGLEIKVNREELGIEV